MNQYQIDSFEQQLRKDPSSRVFIRLAEEYRKGGEFEKAIEVCKEGIKHHPNYPPGRVCLGRCRMALGQLGPARDDFREVLKITPDNPKALKGLASICYEMGDLEEAQTHYEMLAILDPSDVEVVNRLLAIKEKIADREVEIEESFETDSIADLAPLEESAVEPNPLLEPVEEGESGSLFGEVDLEVINDSMVEEVVTEDIPDQELAEEIDPIDLEFDKAIEEDDDVVNAFEDLAPTSAPVAEEPSPAGPVLGAMNPDEEKLLTDGLKHEKMEHYEAALNIYRKLLESRAGDPTVNQHLERLEQLMASESGNRKKIRLLSNWLDKIKGVYYVS